MDPCGRLRDIRSRQVAQPLPETHPTPGVVRFESFEVDVRAGEVRKNGHRIRLQYQPFRILRILLEHPGEVVTREDLQRQIWPSDTFVDFERGLNNAVKRLREALGDSAETPRYIETLPKRGYRFIGVVEGRNEDSPTTEASHAVVAYQPVAVQAMSRSRFRAMLFGTLGLLLAGGLAFGMDIRGLRSRLMLKLYPPGVHSLAVIPLQNLSGDPAQEYFADGMTDALITDLAQIGSLKVISRTSVVRYKKTDKSLPEIARELNVDGVVEGTVQRSGDHVRITAQLIHGASDKHLWANSYERDLRDVFSLERDVTQDIARQIQAHLTPPQNQPPAPPRPVNVNALEVYLQGKYHLDRVGQGFGDEENRKAAVYFQQAIDVDPHFIQAYMGLVDAHSGLLLPSSEDQAICQKAAQKVIELDPNSSNAALFLADQKAGEWDWAGAEAEYRRAIEHHPNDVDAHRSYAQFLDDLGRLDNGWKEQQIAQQLDPSPDRMAPVLSLPGALFIRGQYDRAIELLLLVVESNPSDGQTHLLLSSCYEQKGMYKEAIEELGRTCRLYGYPQIEIRLDRAYTTAGYRGALRRWAQEVEHLQATKQVYFPAYLAGVYGRLGDKDRAFYWLEEAYKHRGLPGVGTNLVHWLKTSPDLELIRNDPRYFDLLRRVGLPQ
jgi:TolB-like protein/DNA-binding winged helix-turn-helix (wHTH) protein/tetratricopeptide (TPR) repeat protein